MEQITYQEFINNILETRGRFGISEWEYKERHHIIPRCMNGGDEEENLIDLYAREHFIAHKLLAEENKDNYQLVYAWHMMCTCGKGDNLRYIANSEEYELAKLLWIPFCKEVASKNSKGRHWYTNDIDDVFEYNCPTDYRKGRGSKARENIGKSSLGRIVNKGKHWYNNGIKNIYAFECPEGYVEGTLPMTDEAKLAHSKSLKNNPNCIKPTNRGFETLKEAEKRIDLLQFTKDFIENKLSDEELSVKYNITVRMSQKYRRAHKLFMNLRGD